MTPDDLAKLPDYLRSRARKGCCACRDLSVQAADALESAWAERDRLKNRAIGDVNEARHLRQRLGQERERAERAEAALARVRALCPGVQIGDTSWVSAKSILNAMDTP